MSHSGTGYIVNGDGRIVDEWPFGSIFWHNGPRDVRAGDRGQQPEQSPLAVNPALWREEFAGIAKYLKEFGDRIPEALNRELQSALERVHSSQL